MALKLYEENSVKAVADAIRSKNGSSNTYKIGDMATAIESISGGDSNGVFIISSQSDAIKFTDTEYGDSVQAALKAGRTVLIYQNSISVYSPIAHIQATTNFNSDTHEYYPVLKLLPLIYEDYQGSGVYNAAFQTAETYKSRTGLITLYISKIDLST